jgi:uncharacterized membrane protein
LSSILPEELAGVHSHYNYTIVTGKKERVGMVASYVAGKKKRKRMPESLAESI